MFHLNFCVGIYRLFPQQPACLNSNCTRTLDYKGSSLKSHQLPNILYTQSNWPAFTLLRQVPTDPMP